MYAEPFSILPFEEESMSDRCKIRRNRSVACLGRPFEQHLLNANVIVKPFDVPQPRYGASDVTVERRRAMCR